MEIDVKYFLLLNGLVIGFIVFSLMRSRKTPTPSRLNLRRNPRAVVTVQEEGLTTDLNAPFEFAGADYDAYIVLDVPPGSTAAEAEENYRELRENARGNKRDLVERAYLEIRKKDRARG